MIDCGCIPTPDSILEDDEIDVFESIIPEGETYRDAMIQILWDYYGSRGIGNCDMTYWIKAMQRRFRQISPVYNLKFKAYDEWLTSQMGADPVDLSDSSSEYKTVSENEDMPDNPSGDTRYLSDRNTVIYNGKTHGGLSSETVSRFLNGIADLSQQFADEFRRQFYHGV